MAIYYRCNVCKNEFSIKLKKCPKCGTPVPRDNKTYKISVVYNGKRVRKSVVGSLALAREVEAKIKEELISGEYYDRRKLLKEKITFDEFVNKYYLPFSKNNKSNLTYRKEKSLYEMWIKDVIGKKQIKSISQIDIEKIKKNMKDANRSERTIEYAITVVKYMFNKAIEWDIYKRKNPAKLVKVPKKDNRRIRFLSKDEANTLLAECKKRNKDVYLMALLSLYTGMRAGEILKLKWQDIDFENKIINIKDTKNTLNRVAYMNDVLVKELKNFLKYKKAAANDYVFNKSGEPHKQIPRTFKTCVKKVGLNEGVTDDRDKVVFHTLRHTFASWLAIQGTPIYTIKELMGHKTLAMTERYSHLVPDAKREAVEKL